MSVLVLDAAAAAVGRMRSSAPRAGDRLAVGTADAGRTSLLGRGECAKSSDPATTQLEHTADLHLIHRLAARDFAVDEYQSCKPDVLAYGLGALEFDGDETVLDLTVTARKRLSSRRTDRQHLVAGQLELGVVVHPLGCCVPVPRGNPPDERLDRGRHRHRLDHTRPPGGETAPLPVLGPTYRTSGIPTVIGDDDRNAARFVRRPSGDT
jgi:hypothetical protein